LQIPPQDASIPFQRSLSFCAMGRAVMSAPPPGMCIGIGTAARPSACARNAASTAA
jgi:hypothetical protein